MRFEKNRRFLEMFDFVKRRKFWTGALVAVLFGAVVLLNVWPQGDVSAGEDYSELKIFTEVLQAVKGNYVEEPQTKELVYGAIKGMLGSLDPHSGFMTPDQYKEMQVDTRGEFSGVGIQIGIKDEILTVIAPIEDTPAFRAGIKAGDRILKINDETTKDMPLFDAVKKMRGPKGTQVTITIMREGFGKPKEFAIVRDNIILKSVKHKMIDTEQGIAYLKLTQFQEKSAVEMASALDGLKKQGMRSLVLDLRNNPGGLLNIAVDVTSQFLPQGQLAVYIKGRTGGRTEYRTSKQFGSYEEMPMIVLVNHGSASASEIVAGALKDWQRAVVLGNQTFGKGSVQTILPLSDGSGIRLTTARYYTPKGTSIQNTGIKPDIEVKLATETAEKRHPVVREKDLKNHLDAVPETEQGAPEEMDGPPLPIDEENDIQLQRAIDILKTWNVFKGISAKTP